MKASYFKCCFKIRL